MCARRAFVLGAVSTAFLAACGKFRNALPPLVWFDDVDLAYAEAKRVGLPVFLSFGATWDCGTKELEYHTYPDREVATLLHDGFVCARVDCSDDDDRTTMELTRRFGIVGVPTLIVTDSVRGRDLWRANQYVKPDELAVALRAARYRA